MNGKQLVVDLVRGHVITYISREHVLYVSDSSK